MTSKNDLTVEELKRRLSYDQESGLFYHLPMDEIHPHSRAWNTRYAGKVSGSLHKQYGYIIISLKQGSKKFKYPAHRLAYLFMVGVWPSDDVMDHKTRVRSDNRWVNIRPASFADNVHNQKKSRRNTSGYTGVYKCGNKWRAQIGCKPARHLGVYTDIREAARAYTDEATVRDKEFSPVETPTTTTIETWPDSSQRRKNPVTGVSWYPPRQNWRARITRDGTEYHLGSFECYDDAVAARKAAETASA